MINLFGFDIFNDSKQEFIKLILDRIKNDKKTIIVSGNPEILSYLKKVYNFENYMSHSLIIPDGIGVVLPCKILGKKIKEKIAGIEVTEALMRLSKKEKLNIYLLGAEKQIVEKASNVCKERFDANIVGFHDGFFDLENCNDIIEDINNKKTDILFVAMGCPRQEVFINKYLNNINAKVLMGVGGSFDVFAGKVKRAPKWMIALGLEWLYRVYKEPFRIKRLGVIPKFMLSAVAFELKNNGVKK